MDSGEIVWKDNLTKTKKKKTIMRNRYVSQCCQCGSKVPVGNGTIRKVGRKKWKCTCLDCKPLSTSEAFELANGDETHAAGIYASNKSAGSKYQSWGAYFPSTGTYIYQNKAGRCIDAPCCGCCN